MFEIKPIFKPLISVRQETDRRCRTNESVSV